MPRPYVKHGLAGLKRKVQVQGLATLDRRSATFRRAMAWRQGLEELGERLTAAKRTILGAATMRSVLLDHGFRWLVQELEAKGGPAIVSARRRQLYPVVMQLSQLSDSLDRAMGQLGRERPKDPPQDLNAYLAQTYGQKKRARATKPRRGPRTAPGSTRALKQGDDSRARAGGPGGPPG